MVHCNRIARALCGFSSRGEEPQERLGRAACASWFGSILLVSLGLSACSDPGDEDPLGQAGNHGEEDGSGGGLSKPVVENEDCGSGLPLPENYDPAVPCTDVAPPAEPGEEQYSCAEQVGWGKCEEPWMAGYCEASCGACVLPPPELPACEHCEAEFSSGVNLAWITFARDIPHPDLEQMSSAFSTVEAAGGRTVRWWFHTNGHATPGYDAQGYARPLEDSHVEGLLRILNQAHQEGVNLVISLWSFDMLQDADWHPDGEQAIVVALDGAKKLLSQDEARQAYIDRYLVPLVRHVKGHPALHSWEIFNEPEGMSSEFGWTPHKVPMADIQKTVNWLADAIHKEAPSALVTNGTWSFQAGSDAVGKNYYSDAELLAAGGREQGTLDYYQVHFYKHFRRALSPFAHPAEYWQLDKPIVIGEFWAETGTEEEGTDVPADEFYTRLFETGYAGAWAWQYQHIDHTNEGEVDLRWPSMKPAMEALYSRYPDELELSCRSLD